jgi:hypothetical protein
MTPNYNVCITQQLDRKGNNNGSSIVAAAQQQLGGWDIRDTKLGDALLVAGSTN